MLLANQHVVTGRVQQKPLTANQRQLLSGVHGLHCELAQALAAGDAVGTRMPARYIARAYLNAYPKLRD